MKAFSVKGLLPLLTGALLGFSLALGGAVLAGFTPTTFNSAEPVSSAGGPPTPVLPPADARVLAEILARVKRDYVEAVSGRQLMDNAVRGMLAELDPHSRYLDPAEYEEIRISTSGTYSGVGLELQTTDGRVGVVTPIEGTPAARAGIKAGDAVLSIDGKTLDEGNVSQAILRMRGPVGSHVLLTIAREGHPEPLAFDLERSPVEVHSVQARLLEPGYAYLRISQFSDTTGKDLRSSLVRLNQETAGGLRGVVLDLRDNPGGVLDAAVDVADSFLERGLIVTASGRSREATFRHEAAPGDLLAGAPLVVLVNGASASASEIVAGALQDNHRATIVGSRTFGKGSVQTVMPLSGGRAIKLTTSRYFTPSGVSIQGHGITPDVALGAEAAATGLDEALELLKARPALLAQSNPAQLHWRHRAWSP
ncbi:MAG: S41 family peptidase [Gammaproteobacteria bacterium]|nr:S41 family peptidase [Gammaproteobacteria bacterium]